MKNEWKHIALRNACLKTSQWKPRSEPRGDFYYIDVSAVSNDTFKITSPQAVNGTTAPGRARKIVHARDVIYATIRPALRRVALVPPQYHDHIASTAFCVVRADRKMAVPEFLYFLLLSDEINKPITDSQHGASYPAVTDKDIFKQEVSLPPFPEQKKIAAVLLKVQQAIEIEERIIQSLHDLKKSTMQHLFTHGLRGEKTKMTEIGEIPESWGVKKIDEILDESLYGLSMRGQTSGSYPILRMNCQIDGGVVFDDLQYVDLDPKTFKKFRLVDGDLLFNRTNSHDLVGRMAVFYATREVVFASYLIRVRLDQHSADPDFINYYFNMNVTQTRVRTLASRGVSQSNISASKLKTFEVPLPSDLDEQADIVRNLKAVDSKIQLHESKKSGLQALFKTTLNRLMTGEIRVNDLDIDVSEVEG